MPTKVVPCQCRPRGYEENDNSDDKGQETLARAGLPGWWS